MVPNGFALSQKAREKTKLGKISMDPATFWKNFNLGSELSTSGAFIYNGIRGFHEMKSLNNGDEAFQVLYNLSVGLERLLKVAVVLLEHEDNIDQESLEKSLITHNLPELLNRIKRHTTVTLGTTHNDLLSLLSSFYKSTRYSHFTLSSVYSLDKELEAIRDYLTKHLNEEITSVSDFFAIENKIRYKKFLRRTVLKIASSIFKIIEDRSRSLNIYTYEQRHGSKAQTVFLGEFDPTNEDILWKELLIFMINAEADCGHLGFLKGIKPLDFDLGLMDDYLACFQSDGAKSEVMDELDHHYQEMESEERKTRLEMINIIGAPGVCFDLSEDEFEEE